MNKIPKTPYLITQEMKAMIRKEWDLDWRIEETKEDFDITTNEYDKQIEIYEIGYILKEESLSMGETYSNYSNVGEDFGSKEYAKMIRKFDILNWKKLGYDKKSMKDFYNKPKGEN